MAKILISSLGTGPLDKDVTKREYKKAVYWFQDSDAKYKTEFIAAALSVHLKVDKIYLIGTGKSMWEEVYRYFATMSNQSQDDNYWLELGEKVGAFKIGDSKIDEVYLSKVNDTIDGYLKYQRKSAAGGSHCYLIDYGLNEKEIWSNFDIFMRIGESLEENDQIYLDITHAFRSIPLFMYIMLDLIRILKFKNLKLSGLFYGMFEASKDFNGRTPVVNLGSLFNITLWARGAYNFINFGNGYLLSELIDDDKISPKVRNISELVNINYLTDFKKEVDSLNSLLETDFSTKPILHYMTPYLKDFTCRFKGINTNSRFQIELARWYFENKRYANGYICLAESIITRILEIYRDANTKINWSKSERDRIKKLIRSYEFSEKTKIEALYDTICTIRNRIAHAGFTGESSFKEDIKKAFYLLDNVEKQVFNNKILEKIPLEVPFNEIF
jgi:CRISPR-associated Csx2 family protein